MAVKSRKHLSYDSIRIDGREYVSHSCWVVGDYGGAGDIGHANIRVLLAECEGRTLECGMSDLCHVQEGCPYGLGEDVLAEIRAERPWLIDAYGSHGSRQVWVRAPLGLRLSSHGFRGDTWIERMDSYPCLSDDDASEVQMEWEQDAWVDWVKSDLIRTLPDDGSREEAEMLGDETLRAAYWAAMEETNTYPEAEYSGVHIDIDRIAKGFGHEIADRLATLYGA